MAYLKPLLILSGVMLILAVLPIWPYAFYQFLRVIVTITAVYGAYSAHTLHKSNWVWILGAIAILFNPIAPISLSREAWVVPDLIAAIILLLASVKVKKSIST